MSTKGGSIRPLDTIKLEAATDLLADGDGWFKRLYTGDGDFVKVILNL